MTSREAENIINSTRNFRDRCIIKCLYFGGMRVQEIDSEHFTVGDLDFPRCVIHVRKSKFGKTRSVTFIDENFMTDLRQFVMGRKASDPVFEVKRRMIQHIVKNAGIAAGITNPYSGAKHVSPHLFRHSIARHLESAGYQLEFIQNFLGHASYVTTADAYGTISLGEMQQQVAQKTGNYNLIGDAKSIRPELPRPETRR